MTNRLKFPVLMLLITALALTVLVSCTSVGIASVEIKEDCDYKTEYVIGDELDLTGLELVVTRTDGEVYTVFATDVREDLKIMNFKTDKEVDVLNVIIEYRGVATSMVIKVTDKASASAKYTVTFSTGEGQRVEPISAGEFETITAPDDPVREGYAFDGWYKQSTYNDKWDFNIDKVVADTTLYAKWSKLYSITFKYDPEYNDIPDVVKYVKAGGNLTDVPALPYVKGMIGSWDRTAFTNIYSNVVVNAKYVTATYTVVFYYMGEDGVTPYVLKTFEDVPYGANLAKEELQEIRNLEKNDVPYNSADKTKHFPLNEEATDEEWLASWSERWSQSFNSITADINIEAKYVVNKYDVVFKLNDGSGSDYANVTDVTHNNPVSRPTTDPVRYGYAFDGWYKNAECTQGNEWNFNTDRVTTDTTVYAKWVKIYTVTFKGEIDCTVDGCVDGKLVCSSCNGDKVGCANCEESGYVDCDECENGVVEKITTLSVREGANVSRVPVPSKEGYTGTWYIGGTPLSDEALQDVRSDKEIVAKYTINTYKVTFYNYNREIIEEQEVAYRSDAIEPTTLPKRLGYKFVSWGALDENDIPYEYKNIKADTEITAKFEADAFNVVFVPNVPNMPSSYSVSTLYDTLVSADNLNYSGYHFDGWYTDLSWAKPWNLGAYVLNVNSLTNHLVNDKDQTPEEWTAEIERRFSVSGADVLTLYAKWSKIHTIALYNDTDNLLGTTTVINGEYLLKEDMPAIEQKEGLEGDWYVRGETTTPFDFTKPIMGDLELAVAYNVKVYTVNFYISVGDFFYSLNVEHGNKIQSSVPEPSVEGKIFKGWDKSMEQIIVEDTDYMAIFESVYYDVTWTYNGLTYAITKVEHGKQAIFPANVDLPVREGYRLTRWNPVKANENDDADINSVKKPLNVTPEWSINVYTVEFKDRENNVYLQYDGQAYVEYQRKDHGQGIDVDATVANPMKEGKDFVGWTIGTRVFRYDNDLNSWILSGEHGDDGVYEISTSAVSLIVKGNKFYYSNENPATLLGLIENNWDENKIFELVETEDGWKQVANDVILTTNKEIAFAGHLFYVVTSNVVIYSNHVTSVYDINYVTNSDDVIATKQYAHGTYSVAPSENLTKEDYVFIGWYTEPEFKNKYVFGSPVTSNLTLYARWEVKIAYTEGMIYALNDSGTAYALIGVEEGFDKNDVVVANFFGNPGLPVDSIGASAFAGNKVIKTIGLPSTLANIGPSAFMNMEGLVSINIPASVSIIPDNAFNGAINLETVIFDNYSTLSTIGMNAFAKTQSLKYSVVDGVKKAFAFPASLTTIESGAFLNSTAITEITIPANVIKIEDKAFAGATGIRYAVFERTTPANLGENVFQNKNSFRVYVPSVSMYTSGAANANWKLIKDKIHEISSIVTIDGVAEWSYNLATDGRAVLIQYLGKELTEVVIPEFLSVNNQTIRVAEIGDYAFDGPIQSIAFDAVVGISANTFASTEQLSNLSITVGSNNSINSGYLFDAYSSVPNLNTLSITPNITIPELFGGTAPTALTVVKTLSGTMSPNFLENCVYVKEVVIGGLTANISAEAFLNCTALEKVVFDNREYSDVNAIGMNAFKGAISLETFEILTSSGTSYGIPEKVTTIGANAFEGTKWLKSNSNDMIIIGNGILYRYNGTDSIVAIPENVVSITASAFAGNEKLRQVYVVNPQSALLTDIGANAFAGCVNLESVVLSAGVENVGASAFEGDNKLVSIIHFGDGEPSLVGDYAFNKTHPEMKIYLPATASKWTGYSSELVENLTLFEEIKTVDSVEEKWIWIYGKAKGNNGIMIIKALGMQGDNLALTVPEQLNGMDVYEIADYALPRVTTKLSYSTFIKNLGSKPFGGVTFLTEATIRNSYNTHNVTPEAMMSLFAQNEELSVLNSDATISIKNLIGGTLPQNVKTVNILANATAIVANFLEDNEYVEYITVTTYDKVGDALTNPTITALEETLSIDKAYNIASVGAKAFRNTAWMKSYEGEYVIVLGGNLVDYKGVNSILEIPETVEFINGSIFENDETIEVVNIPATVKNIGDHAFSGAINLTKIFISATTAPTIYADTFDINVLTNNGMEIFVPASALADEQSGYKAGTWNGLNPVSDSGIVRVKNQTSSNSFEEYIINSNDKKLLLSRRYTVTYSNGLVTEIVENSTAIAPTIVNDRASGNSYSIQALGNNVFMSAVQNVVIDIMHQVNDYSFKNLGELDEVTISGLVNQERKLTSANIVKIFNDHDAKTIAFVGNVTLDTLVGEDSTIDSLVGVKITDGVIETVDELLKGWTSITNVEFPASIEKVGINSLEDTAWYKDYTSSVYGNDFVVLGGSLLYKYKGAGTGLVTIPNAVKIVNTGAFSKYESGAWSSTLPVKQIRFGTESNSNAHTILEHAFSGCKQLNSILLPESMSNIAPSAFDGTAFTITNGMLIVAEENGKNATLVKFTGDESDFVDGTLTIPSNVKKIAAGAFQNVTALKKITYPNDSVLTTICEDAFNGATSLLEVQLPSTVKFIGKNAFYNTLWFGKAIQKQVDVMIGGVLYQKVVPGASYTLYDNVTSIVEDALVPIMPFTIDGITYSTDENVRVTELIIEEGSFLKASELYSILSKEWVDSIITNGQVTLSGLIGSDEPLDNIVRIGFLQRTTSIAAGYAENWTNVSEITNVPASVTEIGENAFRGTKWFENQNKPGFNFAGESNVVIKYVGDETDLEIGSYVGETVTGITADAFRGNENLKSIVFGKYSKLSKIPAGAFRDCINLESIVFNDLITEFGEDAFANTPWLANYDNDFVIIDGVMIEYKGAGGEIVIPKGTTKIYPYVFRGNDTITSVRFDENCLMTAIEANTFRDCVNLEELIINEHILSVDRTAVQGTKWLAQTSQIKVNLGGSILYYENAYHGIKRIVLYVGTENSIIIPNTVTEIVPNAFKRVTSLAQITFSEGKLVAIPDGAFEGCTSLREVVFASAITNIGENAFAGTPWLAEQSAEFVIRNGILIKYNGTSTAVEIPENVTLIGESAFSGSQIVSIDMSKANIETILAGTFSGISTLENVVFSNATNYVGEGAFNGTKYLADAPAGLLIANGVALIAYIGNETDITIPNGVRYLNADVFQNNANLLSITFTGEIEIAPNAFVNNSQLADVYGTEYITYVGEGAFSGTKYQAINVSSGYVVVNGRLVDYVGTETQLVIPSDVEYIPEGIFGGNENIVSVDFSKASSTLSIEANAFRNAVNLKDIVFGDNIDYIGSRAFYNTAWMESYSDALIISPAGKLLAYVRENASVTIPNTVKSFARDVFKGNKNITSVYFASGSNVNIPTEAFKDCTSLLNVTFNGTFQIGENAFQNTEWYKLEANKTSNRGFVVVKGMLIGYAGSATIIEIPSTVTYIYDYVFNGNENITSLGFASGSTVSSIKGETFVGCTQLTNVTFPNSLVELDMGAFDGTPWKENLTTDFIVVGNKLLAYVGNGGDIVIPSGVNANSILEISPNAFQGNTSITSISFDMASDLEIIPNNAFNGCINLDKVSFPEKIKYVGQDAFKGTKWLNRVVNYELTTEDEGEVIDDAFVLNGTLLFYFGDGDTDDGLYFFNGKGISHIALSAFVGTPIKSLFVYVEDPEAITIASGALDDLDAIYVKDALVQGFRESWSEYALKIFSQNDYE